MKSKTNFSQGKPLNETVIRNMKIANYCARFFEALNLTGMLEGLIGDGTGQS